MSNTTARFHFDRLKHLDKVFDKGVMVQVWRRVVKGQMRKLDISDLHDYYDFNVNIDEKVERIRRRILNGRYRSNKPLVYKTEKKLGISRHLLIPSPSDALDIVHGLLRGLHYVLTNNLSKEENHERIYRYPFILLRN